MDRDVLIRKWAFDTAPAVVLPDRRHFVERARRDPYPPIRRDAFRQLASETGRDLADFTAFLFDRSHVIRHSCQSLISGHFQTAVAPFYRAAAGTAASRMKTVSILGLVETGDASDSSIISSLVSDRSAVVRRTAIRALRRINTPGNIDYLALISTDVPSVACEAALTLLSVATPVAVIWEEFLRNPDPRSLLAALRIAPRFGKWARLYVYLRAVATARPELFPYAVHQLKLWTDLYNASFTQPTREEALILPELLEGVLPVLPQDLAEQLNFLLQSVIH